MENSNNKIEKCTFNEDLKILRGVYNLNNMFKRNLTTHDLRFASKKNIIFNEIIEEVSENFNKGNIIGTLLFPLEYYFFFNIHSL